MPISRRDRTPASGTDTAPLSFPRTASGVGTGQASSMYLFSFYLGSSVFGGLAGTAWSRAEWTGVAGEAGVLFAVTLVLALLLRNVPSKVQN